MFAKAHVNDVCPLWALRAPSAAYSQKAAPLGLADVCRRAEGRQVRLALLGRRKGGGWPQRRRRWMASQDGRQPTNQINNRREQRGRHHLCRRTLLNN